MVTMICQLELRVFEAYSLKDKRNVIKSIIERTKNKYKISIIESDFHELWQKAELSLCFCSMDVKNANNKLEGIIKYIEFNPYIEIYDVNREEIHL